MSRKTNNAANGNAVSNYDSELAFQYDTEFMDQHTANPNRAIAPTTDTDVMGKNAKTLYAKATIFAKAKADYTEEQIGKFIQYLVTPTSRARAFFDFMESNYLKHVLNGYRPHCDRKMLNTLHQFMVEDPFGDKDYPKVVTDGMWRREKQTRRSASGTTEMQDVAVKTTFHRTLDMLWLEYYMILRSSLRLWMDNDACDSLRRAIADRESKKKITDADMLTKGKRITWDWIKQHVYDHICILATGDYHYMPLMITSRKDGDSRTDWCNRVHAIWRNVQKFGKGWEKLPHASFVRKLWDWLSRDEQKVIFEVLEKHSTKERNYKTVAQLISKEQLDWLITTIRRIEQSKFSPQPYKRKWSPKGLQRLYYDRASYKALLEKIDEGARRIKAKDAMIRELQARLAGKRGTNTVNKQTGGGKGKGNGKGNGNKSPENIPLEHRTNKNAPICQSCVSKGLGPRRHWKCDPVRQKAAIAAKERRDRIQKGQEVGRPSTHCRPIGPALASIASPWTKNQSSA